MAERKDDIEKYLRGELSPAEMHALEKKALNDPFLADALEGAAHLSAEDLASDLHTLQSALHEKINRKPEKVVPLWVWTARIAAGLLLLALSTFVVFNLIDKNERQTQLAENDIAEPPAQPEDATAIDSAYANNEQRTAARAATQQETTSNPTKPQQGIAGNAQQQPDTQPGIEPLALKDEEVSAGEKLSEITMAEDAVADAVPPVVSDQEKTEAKPIAKGYAAEEARAKRESIASALDEDAEDKAAHASNRVVRGQVTSIEDGKGLPGVNVVIKGTNIGTITDAEGNYQITTEEGNVALLFSFIGLQSTEAHTSAGDEVNVQMSQDVSQLSEIVVTGYGGERKADEEYTTIEMAAPAGGRKAFKQYLEKNLHYPEQAIKNNVEGKVTVQFTVEASGDLTNFKVLKGIGSGCDEEVIRLIKQGPKWTPTKRAAEPAKDKVRVRLRFSLPKK